MVICNYFYDSIHKVKDQNLTEYFDKKMKTSNEENSLFNKIRINITSHIKTSLFLDYSRIIELILPILIAYLLIYFHYHPESSLRFQFIFLFLLWFILALVGFFIPTITLSNILAFPGPQEPGIPILIKIKSKGGFIAGRKIKLSAEVINISTQRNSKKEFQDYYEKCSIAYFNSIKLPIKKGKFLEGTPDVGNITINIEKCKGNVSILYNSPGIYTPIITYKTKRGPVKKINADKDEHAIKISPSENYISLRNYAITYSLTLVILLLTILQLKII